MAGTVQILAFTFATLVLPAILVFFVPRGGFIYGVLSCWLIPMGVIWYGREVLHQEDSAAGGLWMLFGWVFGLIYCLIMKIIRDVVTGVYEDLNAIQKRIAPTKPSSVPLTRVTPPAGQESRHGSRTLMADVRAQRRR